MGAACRFVTRALPGHLADRIEDEGFEVSLLRSASGVRPEGPPTHAHWAGVDWADDAAETRDALSTNPADFVVLDHYAFDARWQKAVGAPGTRLMVIDDLADRSHHCDLILDQNFGRAPADYDGLVPKDCKRLIGPRYALLRPEFAELRASAVARRSKRLGPRHLHITMGGVDRADATSVVLKAIRGAVLPPDMQITVIMGSKAPALDRVLALVRSLPFQSEVVVDSDNMAAHMASADLAIGAGGSTTWERCCLGLPSIIVETAENQAGIAARMAAAGAAFDCGPVNSTDFKSRLQSALARARAPENLSRMARACSELCDGQGAQRAVAQMMASADYSKAAS